MPEIAGGEELLLKKFLSVVMKTFDESSGRGPQDLKTENKPMVLSSDKEKRQVLCATGGVSDKCGSLLG